MPWLETEPLNERKKFILEWCSGDFGVAELCRRHGVSRKTGYKWIERYEVEGPEGLLDRSHRPHTCPHATPEHVLDEACRIRTSRRTLMGAKKVRKRLVTEHPGWPVPSRRALHTHFVRQGLVPKRRRRRANSSPSQQSQASRGPIRFASLAVRAPGPIGRRDYLNTLNFW